MSRPSIATLYEHLTWADEEARAAVRTLDPGSAAYREATTLYAHVAASEEVWLARLEGRPPEHAVWPDLSLAEAGELAATTADALSSIAASLDDGSGDAAITYRNSSGNEYKNRVEDILLHVALHGCYHRGQIALVVREGGGSPRSTDYIAFLRGDPAPAHERPG